MAYLISNDMIPYYLENELAVTDGVLSQVTVDNVTHMEIITYPAQENFENGAILGLIQRPFIDFAISCGIAGEMTSELINMKYGDQIPSDLVSSIVENFSREYDNFIIIPEGVSIAITAAPYHSIYELMVNGAISSIGIALNDNSHNRAIGKYSIVGGNASMAIGESSIALGSENIAGSRCFKFDLTHEYTTDDYNIETKIGKYYLTSVDGIESARQAAIKEKKDLIYTMYLTSNYDFNGKVLSVGENYIEVDNYLILNSETNLKVHSGSYLFFPDNPEIGSDIIGTGAVSIGYNNKALSVGAFAEGCQTIAEGKYAHAEGRLTTAAYCGHAEGYSTKALGFESHAEGMYSQSIGPNSHAEGRETKSIGSQSHVEGYKTEAIGNDSHSEGLSTKSSGNYSHAEGYTTESKGQASHAEGYETISEGSGAHSEGYRTNAIGTRSHAEGEKTTAYSDYSHAEGYSANVARDFIYDENGKILTNAEIISIHDTKNEQGSRINAFSLSKGIGSHVEGFSNLTFGNYAHAEGQYNKATQLASHAEGSETNSSGFASHSEGKLTNATTECAHAEGHGTSATALCSHAEGRGTTASGIVSHAEGDGCTATAQSAHVEGQTCHATGQFSHAEGYSSHAVGVGSHAENRATWAKGMYSHAEGESCVANAKSSHVEGISSQTSAAAEGAHAEGWGTYANAPYQHVQGKYNITGTQAVIVGNGDSTKRSNAYTLDWSGNGWYAGTVETSAIILRSSTEGSTKKFKVTVDDNGTLTVVEFV